MAKTIPLLNAPVWISEKCCFNYNICFNNNTLSTDYHVASVIFEVNYNNTRTDLVKVDKGHDDNIPFPIGTFRNKEWWHKWWQKKTFDHQSVFLTRTTRQPVMKACL